MINLERTDKREIWLSFTIGSLDALIDAFNNVRKSCNASIEVVMDMSILTRKRRSNAKKVTVELRPGDETRIARYHNQIIWWFYHEDIDDAIWQLTRCKEEGLFYPPEFLFVQVQDSRQDDFVYCRLID